MYLVHVSADGDTEIRRVFEEPDLGGGLLMETVEDLVRELKDYGHGEAAIAAAIEETGNTNEWVEV